MHTDGRPIQFYLPRFAGRGETKKLIEVGGTRAQRAQGRSAVRVRDLTVACGSLVGAALDAADVRRRCDGQGRAGRVDAGADAGADADLRPKHVRAQMGRRLGEQQQTAAVGAVRALQTGPGPAHVTVRHCVACCRASRSEPCGLVAGAARAARGRVRCLAVLPPAARTLFTPDEDRLLVWLVNSSGLSPKGLKVFSTIAAQRVSACRAEADDPQPYRPRLILVAGAGRAVHQSGSRPPS